MMFPRSDPLAQNPSTWNPVLGQVPYPEPVRYSGRQGYEIQPRHRFPGGSRVVDIPD